MHLYGRPLILEGIVKKPFELLFGLLLRLNVCSKALRCSGITYFSNGRFVLHFQNNKRCLEILKSENKIEQTYAVQEPENEELPSCGALCGALLVLENLYEYLQGTVGNTH